MADRYWNPAGAGNWGDTSSWAAIDGGATGETVPSASDDAFFTSTNVNNCTVNVSATCLSLSFTGGTGYTGTLAGSSSLAVSGSLTLNGGMIRTYTGTITFNATATGKTIASNGVSFGGTVTLNGSGGGWTLSDAFSSSGAFNIDQGTFNTGNYDMTCLVWRSNNVGTRSITLGTSTITCTSGASATVFQIVSTGSPTVSAASSTIKFTGTGAGVKGFAGGAFTYGTLWFSVGTSTGNNLVLQGNTFSVLKDTGTGAHGLFFSNGVTQTIADFQVAGSSGKLVKINSCNASGTEQTTTHTLNYSGASTVSSDYLDIQHSVATPATTWYAGANSTDNQAVVTAGSGWIFTVPPGGVSSVSPQFVIIF